MDKIKRKIKIIENLINIEFKKEAEKIGIHGIHVIHDDDRINIEIYAPTRKEVLVTELFKNTFIGHNVNVNDEMYQFSHDRICTIEDKVKLLETVKSINKLKQL